MKTKQMMVLVLGLILTISVQAQSKTIAVAYPSVDGIESLNPKIAATYIRLELIKLNQFLVLDEFDMAEVLKEKEEYNSDCYGLKCLTQLGQDLNVDYVMSGSFVELGNKIVITLKWIDVKEGKLYKSAVKEFESIDAEIYRMVEILLKQMTDVPVDNELLKRLEFKDEVITSDNVGKINNSGPRVGGAYLMGSLNEFAKRPEQQGGLEIKPVISMIGYQIEGQYVGTENFSALVEGIINFGGLEQGVFIPSVTLLNGFRFGRAGWEFAFGPSFSIRKMSFGFFDTNNQFGKGKDYYFNDSDWRNYSYETYKADSSYYDNYNNYNAPNIEDVSNYSFSKNFDKRGDARINTTWVMAFGRTFTSGALNIPVNVFYSSTKGGGMFGMSVGFNVMRSKYPIHQ
jgi:hypothetical protein